MERAKAPSGVRKVKKKQVKDESDRIKQAEKKKRRLEKALATSAAIRSELEKKKLKKIEEQQRLDEEGAAIAEAVALHVLLGEDSEDSCNVMLKNNDKGFNPWDCASHLDLLMDGRQTALARQEMSKYPWEELGWAPDAPRTGCNFSNWGSDDWRISSGPFGRNSPMPYCDKGNWESTGISAGLIAAQAVSSLQIAEEAHVDSLVCNRTF